MCCDTVAQAASIQRQLRADGIDFRLWYGGGIQGHRHFRTLERAGLSTTGSLAPRLFGILVAVDLRGDAIRRLVAAVAEGMRTGR